MFAVVFQIRQQLPFSGVAEFVVLVLAGGATYALMVGLIAFQFNWNVERNVSSVLTTILDQ